MKSFCLLSVFNWDTFSLTLVPLSHGQWTMVPTCNPWWIHLSAAAVLRLACPSHLLEDRHYTEIFFYCTATTFIRSSWSNALFTSTGRVSRQHLILNASYPTFLFFFCIMTMKMGHLVGIARFRQYVWGALKTAAWFCSTNLPM